MQTINDIQFISDWTEVTIETYDKISRIESVGELDSQIQLLSILSRIDESFFWACSLTDMQQYREALNFLQSFDVDDITKIDKTIVIAGSEFKTTSNWSDINVSQFFDFKSIVTMKNVDRSLARLLAIYLIPKQETVYGTYDTNEVIDFLYKNLDIKTAYELVVFMFRSLREFVSSTVTYSLTTALKTKTQRAKLIESLKKTEALLHEISFS